MNLKPLAAPILPPAPLPGALGQAAAGAAGQEHEPARAPVAELVRRFVRQHARLAVPCGALGFAAGLRTSAPLVALTGNEGARREGAFGAGFGRVLAGTVSAGEFVATKLPFLPRRASPTSALFHVVAGAAAGAYGASELARSVPVGAAAGALAAGAGFAAALAVRAATVGRVPGAALSLVQDTAALALARFGARELVLARA